MASKKPPRITPACTPRNPHSPSVSNEKSVSKTPELLHASGRRLSQSELKALQREKEVERRIEYIRQNPRLDRYGRPVPDGTPLGSGDASWRRQHGVGAKYSPMTPMLGIGISRDSFLPDSVRFNDKMALRVTPRSSKLTKEVKAWAVKYGVDKDPQFMKKLILS